jgi:hypothetical protein
MEAPDRIFSASAGFGNGSAGKPAPLAANRWSLPCNPGRRRLIHPAACVFINHLVSL